VRYIFYTLAALLIAIQYPLWIGKGGLLSVYQLDKEVKEQQNKNLELWTRYQ
jgi:cell division protein FtsB